MFRPALAVVCCSAAVAFADPEVVIDCPAGMHFVENKGCVANLAPKCPGGTKFENGKCVAIVDTSCPAGMHFVAGTGCVAKATAKASTSTPPPPPPQPVAEPQPAPAAKGKKGGTFSGNIFSDRLQATCSNLHFEVQGAPRLTGVRAQLLVDGLRLSDEQLLDIGDVKHIEGVVKGKRVDLKIQQAVFGTRYTLNVDGEECRLGK
ncbi:MAG: hypothetical protein DI536_00825 [Archangium gephyra]|uniref:Lipoprotein n=1 Tax=Archangium gephyra TaxID=48 RepID=A0A2W5TWH5_9BACT|nr:MAG: hypothetical protein DI536_00825 [Archangium gephyra]